MTKSKLFFFAGEPSGDLLGAPLITSDYDCVGVGGPAMQKAGLEPLFDFEDFQVMGFSAVLPALPRILKRLYQIKNWIIKNKPCGVILIDYAEFNLLLADKLRKAGYTGKIIQYVCPSIWAWRKNRKRLLEKNLNHLLAILPFEKKLFEKLPVSYVGHPLKVETLPIKRSGGIALFPGSRREQLLQNLPIQLEAARLLGEPIYISVARPKLHKLIEERAPGCILVSSEERYDLMKKVKGAFATCGTVTLELGLHQTPTVVSYKLSSLHYFLARHLFKIRLPYYSLVNLIADRELCPEFIHKKIDPKEMADTLARVMKNPLRFAMDEMESKNPKMEMLHALSLP